MHPVTVQLQIRRSLLNRCYGYALLPLTHCLRKQATF